MDFCPTATFLQHSSQAGAHHTPAWVRNNIIACAKCPYGSCEFSSILNRSLCRLTSQLYSHLPTASLLQDEHTGLSILSSIYSPKLQQMPPKTTEKKTPMTTRDELFLLALNTLLESTAHNRSVITKCLKLHNYHVSSSPLYADPAPITTSTRNNYSKSNHTIGAVLLCPRKFICAVSCTGHSPSQLFTINARVTPAVPLRPDSPSTDMLQTLRGTGLCLTKRTQVREVAKLEMSLSIYIYIYIFFFFNTKI